MSQRKQLFPSGDCQLADRSAVVVPHSVKVVAKVSLWSEHFECRMLGALVVGASVVCGHLSSSDQ